MGAIRREGHGVGEKLVRCARDVTDRIDSRKEHNVRSLIIKEITIQIAIIRMMNDTHRTYSIASMAQCSCLATDRHQNAHVPLMCIISC